MTVPKLLSDWPRLSPPLADVPAGVLSQRGAVAAPQHVPLPHRLRLFLSLLIPLALLVRVASLLGLGERRARGLAGGGLARLGQDETTRGVHTELVAIVGPSQAIRGRRCSLSLRADKETLHNGGVHQVLGLVRASSQHDSLLRCFPSALLPLLAGLVKESGLELRSPLLCGQLLLLLLLDLLPHGLSSLLLHIADVALLRGWGKLHDVVVAVALDQPLRDYPHLNPHAAGLGVSKPVRNVLHHLGNQRPQCLQGGLVQDHHLEQDAAEPQHGVADLRVVLAQHGHNRPEHLRQRVPGHRVIKLEQQLSQHDDRAAHQLRGGL
eukprot:RCo018645